MGAAPLRKAHPMQTIVQTVAKGSTADNAALLWRMRARQRLTQRTTGPALPHSRALSWLRCRGVAHAGARSFSWPGAHLS